VEKNQRLPDSPTPILVQPFQLGQIARKGSGNIAFRTSNILYGIASGLKGFHEQSLLHQL
jgi:hypothetical protein